MKRMQTGIARFVCVYGMISASLCLAQGPLAPPGAPAPTMKTLDQAEPRIPIDSLPITITNPGSYYVTADLTGVVGQDGITVAADNVTLDLNGFVLSGLPGQTTGDGIRQGGTGNRQNITVKNGSVREWSSDGVDLQSATACRVANLAVTSNGSTAIAVGSGSLVEGCTVAEHGSFGILAFADSVIRGCTVQDCLVGIGGGVALTVDGCHVRDNTSSGVDVGAGSVVSKTTSIVNGADGFRLGEGSTIRDCAARLNSQVGIRADDGSTVIGCSLSRNVQSGIDADPGCTVRDCTVVISGWDGINANNGSTVRDCTVKSSGQDGIEVASDCRVEGNLVEDSGAAAGDAVVKVTGQNNEIRGNSILNGQRGLVVTGTENTIADNVVRGSADNYDFASGNQLNLLLCEIPESIDWPASVKVAGTLTGISGANGITINASDVKIDLDGHALIGVPGSLHGIEAPLGQSNLDIRNGTVREWGRVGIFCSPAIHSTYQDLSVVLNGTDPGSSTSGFSAGANSTLTRCISRGHELSGFSIQRGSTVTDCMASSNLSNGFTLQSGCVISRCTASGNRDGIAAWDAVITECTALNNDENGIELTTTLGGTITGCIASDNTGHGISVRSNARIVNNTIRGNGRLSGTGAGIFASESNNRIENNVVLLNDWGLDIDGTNNWVSGNTVRENTDNYDFAAGNQLNLLLGELPESIDWPASVKLAGTLTGIAGTNGITIASDDVTIDLDGHALVGVTGSLKGIDVPADQNNITVKNGVIRDWGGTGVDCTTVANGLFADLLVRSNGWESANVPGFRAGDNATVTRCVAEANEDVGIRVGSGSTVLACSARTNGFHGFQASEGTVFQHCSAMDNNASGFIVPATTISDCSALRNQGVGFNVQDDSAISDCSATGNGASGIIGFSSCRIQGNTCEGNGNSPAIGAGVFVNGSDNRIEGNTLTNNDRGLDVSVAGNLIIRNSASGNTDDYGSISANNTVGEIVDTSAGGGTLDETHSPWANFSF